MKDFIENFKARSSLLNHTAKATLKVRYFGISKIPLIFAVSPKIKSLDSNEVQVQIPLNYFTKNHENCMYFGALCIGADLAGGLLALNLIGNQKIRFLFKDVRADFLKRCEGEALFVCRDGDKIRSLISEAVVKKERLHIPLNVDVYCPEKLGNEICAKFQLTLSIKSQTSKTST